VAIIKLKLRHGHQQEVSGVAIIKLKLRHGHQLELSRVSMIKQYIVQFLSNKIIRKLHACSIFLFQER